MIDTTRSPLGALRIKRGDRRGVTLTEVMVAVVVITIGIMGLMQAFSFISRSVRISRQRTIASNLAQEKIETLKQLSYSQLLVTTSTISDGNFNPSLTYDAVNYPPETLSLWGGTPLIRTVYVSFAAINNGVVTPLPWSNGDPGLKEITTYVLWNQDGTWRKIVLTNLLENPNISALNSTISGSVTQAGGGALAGVQVQVVGSRQWQAITDASGNYSFSVAAGTYTVSASSAGFYAQMSGAVSAPAGGGATQNFTLSPIATGTVSAASVYIDSSLVVGQVVASTVTQCADSNAHGVEFVEVFNPTPNNIPFGQAGVPSVRLNYLAQGGGGNTNIPLTYVSTYVPAGGYYLIANATNFYVNGGWVNADAYYTAPLNLYDNVIAKATAGAIQLADASGKVFEGVGWGIVAGAVAPWSEGSSVMLSAGIQHGQVVRMSSACALNDAYGRAYDSNDNGNNFFYASALTTPARTTATTRPVISGVPAIGGFASANDGNSAAASIVAGIANAPPPGTQVCPYAYFNAVGVATGTWTVGVASGAYAQTITNVAVAQGATTNILNGVTSPASPYGFAHVALTATTTSGYISGTVTTTTGAPLSGITVSGGGSSSVTGASGAYFITALSGATTVVANPNNLNPNFVSQSSPVTVNTGLVANANFVLSQGGVVKGYVTTGLSPLSGVVVSAGSGQSGATDTTGNFYINNLSTGTYVITPSLDSSQASSPGSVSVTLTTPGSSVSAGTFTVSGAYATLSGSLLNSGSAITTGVLVIASSVTIPDPAPTIYASSSASISPYYAASSKADGTYSVLVRGSTTYQYNVRAYYPVVNINTGVATSSSKLRTGVSATPGASVPNQDFSWP